MDAGNYKLDLIFDGDSCELLSNFTVDCKDGYSAQGDSKFCSPHCKLGKEVKVKEGSCQKPELKASIKSKTLDLGYLKKQNPYLKANRNPPSRTIQVQPSAKFGISNIGHNGQGLDSWVKLSRELTNQSGVESSYLHFFTADFDAAGIPDSTELTATVTFKGTAQDYNKKSAQDDQVVADNITLQVRVFAYVYT